MTLQTHEEEEMLRCVRHLASREDRIKRVLIQIVRLLEEIAVELRGPQFKPTTRVSVTPE